MLNTQRMQVNASQWPEFAVKTLNSTKLEELNYLANVNREIAIMSTMSKQNNKNIVQFFGSFYVDKNVYLILEFARFGELLPYLPITVAQCRFVVKEIVQGLSAIHSHGFVYGMLLVYFIIIMEIFL